MFADNVVRRVAHQQEKVLAKDYLWFLAGIIFVLLSAAVTLVITGFRFDLGFLEGMSNYKGLGIFAILFIIFINWLDRRLVQRKFSRV